MTLCQLQVSDENLMKVVTNPGKMLKHKHFYIQVYWVLELVKPTYLYKTPLVSDPRLCSTSAILCMYREAWDVGRFR